MTHENNTNVNFDGGFISKLGNRGMCKLLGQRFRNLFRHSAADCSLEGFKTLHRIEYFPVMY